MRQRYFNKTLELVCLGHLSYFEFLGLILGKAMYDGILVESKFANFFLHKLLHIYNYSKSSLFLQFGMWNAGNISDNFESSKTNDQWAVKPPPYGM